MAILFEFHLSAGLRRLAMRAISKALEDPRKSAIKVLSHLKQPLRRPIRCALLIAVGLAFRGSVQLDGRTFAGARLAGTSIRSGRTSPLDEQRGGLLQMHAESKARLREIHLAAMKMINTGNKQEGIRQLMEVADAGCLPAMRDLGIMYSQGFHGLPKDIGLSLQWSTKAGDGGDGSANYNLAVSYLTGMNGVPVNKKEAAKRFAMAGEAGIEAAMTNLATMLIKGDGIPRDMQLGAQWLVRAAERSGKLEDLVEKIEQGSVDPETAQALEENMAKLRKANKNNPYDKIDGKVEYWDDMVNQQQEQER